MIGTILQMGKFTDPLNEAEVRAIVTEPHYFDYAQQLANAASRKWLLPKLASSTTEDELPAASANISLLCGCRKDGGEQHDNTKFRGLPGSDLDGGHRTGGDAVAKKCRNRGGTAGVDHHRCGA